MLNSKLALGIFVLGLSVSPGLAQQIYGSVGLGYQFNDMGGPDTTGTPSDEPSNYNQLQTDLSFGVSFDSGYYGQVDLRYSDTDVMSTAEDVLHQGAMIALRGGRHFEKFSAGAFLGYVDTDSDSDVTDDDLYRVIGGLEGRYHFSDQFYAFGELGHIGGPKGDVDTDGLDGIHNATYVNVGVNYQILPKISVEGWLGYADGSMDDDPAIRESALIKSIGFGVTYDFNVPGLSGYARANYSDYFQTSENDQIYVTTLQLGVTYQFGAKPSKSDRLRPLVPYEEWMAFTGSYLE